MRFLLRCLFLLPVLLTCTPDLHAAGTFITASAGAGGTVVPKGKVPLSPGSAVLFQVVPEQGYHVKRLLVDGTTVGDSAVSVFHDGRNHKVSVTFERDVLTAILNAGEGGTITPQRVELPYGTRNVKYSIKPFKGNRIADVRLNGVSLGGVDRVQIPLVTGPVTIEASFTSETNSIPVANAGEDSVAMAGESVTVDAGASRDADGDPLSFSWSFVSKPAGSSVSFSASNVAAPVFVPDVEGFYVLQVAVSDGTSVSYDTVEVAVAEVPNLFPVADAGASREIPTKVRAFLDGRKSRGAGGIPLSYNWEIVSKPQASAASLQDAGSATPSLTPDVDGLYVVRLVVQDGQFASIPSEVTITAVNVAPVAVLKAADFATVGRALVLDGSGSSDLNGDALSYSWSITRAPAGSTATLSDYSGPTVTFVPDTTGEYVFSLAVSDGRKGDSATVSANSSVKTIPLAFRVLDAEYSLQLDKIVMVGAAPSNALHVYDPLSGSDVTVHLPLSPTCVSVGPDGLYAAVGHNGWISWVDLVNGKLLKTLSVSADAVDVVLAGNGFAYVFPIRDQWSQIHSIELATGKETLSAGYSIYAGTRGKLHPSGLRMYGADNGLSPSDIERYDISGGTATVMYDSPYHGDYGMCGDLWMSQDGLRIFTKCGNVFRASDQRAEDMLYNGKLDPATSVQHLTHSSAAGTVAVLPASTYYNPNPEGSVAIHNYDFLTLRERLMLPPMTYGGRTWKTQGKFVFYDSKGERLHVVVQLEQAAGVLYDFAVVSY